MTQQALQQARHRRLSPLARCLPWAVAALTFGAAATAQARNPYEGEGAAIQGAAPSTELHLPASRHAVVEQAVETASVDSSSLSATGSTAAQQPLSRSDVRSSAKRWKQANIATPSGEVGDTAEVLQARESFYALQTDVRETEYLAAAAEREREAELAAREQALAEYALVEPGSDSFIDETVALQDGSTPQQLPADEREIYVRPEMTIGELMSYLEDSPAASDVTVLMVSAEDDVD